jgi:hypothetical protein
MTPDFPLWDFIQHNLKPIALILGNQYLSKRVTREANFRPAGRLEQSAYWETIVAALIKRRINPRTAYASAFARGDYAPWPAALLSPWGRKRDNQPSENDIGKEQILINTALGGLASALLTFRNSTPHDVIAGLVSSRSLTSPLIHWLAVLELEKRDDSKLRKAMLWQLLAPPAHSASWTLFQKEIQRMLPPASCAAEIPEDRSFSWHLVQRFFEITHGDVERIKAMLAMWRCDETMRTASEALALARRNLNPSSIKVNYAPGAQDVDGLPLGRKEPAPAPAVREAEPAEQVQQAFAAVDAARKAMAARRPAGQPAAETPPKSLP